MPIKLTEIIETNEGYLVREGFDQKKFLFKDYDGWKRETKAALLKWLAESL